MVTYGGKVICFWGKLPFFPTKLWCLLQMYRGCSHITINMWTAPYRLPCSNATAHVPIVRHYHYHSRKERCNEERWREIRCKQERCNAKKLQHKEHVTHRSAMRKLCSIHHTLPEKEIKKVLKLSRRKDWTFFFTIFMIGFVLPIIQYWP